jgi:hypothetical protein
VAVSEDYVGQANEAYDQAEQASLAALASGADDITLRSLAQRTAGVAKDWN